MLAQYVVLGLLKERPMHGYEIKQRIEKISGLFWKVSYGSLYPALHKLTEKGLIGSEAAAPAVPGRKVFHLTAPGEKTLLAWLRTGGTEAGINRNTTNEFLLKFIFFSYLPPAERERLIRARMEMLAGKLAEIAARQSGSGKKEAGDFYKRAMGEYIVRAVQHEHDWLAEVLRRPTEKNAGPAAER